jgi:hypothetical protein
LFLTGSSQVVLGLFHVFSWSVHLKIARIGVLAGYNALALPHYLHVTNLSPMLFMMMQDLAELLVVCGPYRKMTVGPYSQRRS